MASCLPIWFPEFRSYVIIVSLSLVVDTENYYYYEPDMNLNAESSLTLTYTISANYFHTMYSVIILRITIELLHISQLLLLTKVAEQRLSIVTLYYAGKVGGRSPQFQRRSIGRRRGEKDLEGYTRSTNTNE